MPAPYRPLTFGSFLFPKASDRYTLSATTKGLQDTGVLLNGTALLLGENDALPKLAASAQAAGPVAFDPETITFLTFKDAGNRGAE